MEIFRRDSEQAELERLLHGRPNFRVHTSKSQVAAALWDYGEDDLAERAIAMSDDELKYIENISAWFEDPPYPLPMTGQRITHNHVHAFAAITLFEGCIRPLGRTRRPRSGIAPTDSIRCLHWSTLDHSRDIDFRSLPPMSMRGGPPNSRSLRSGSPTDRVEVQ